MKKKSLLKLLLLLTFSIGIFQAISVKADPLPGYGTDRYVMQTDNKTIQASGVLIAGCLGGKDSGPINITYNDSRNKPAYKWVYFTGKADFYHNNFHPVCPFWLPPHLNGDYYQYLVAQKKANPKEGIIELRLVQGNNVTKLGGTRSIIITGYDGKVPKVGGTEEEEEKKKEEEEKEKEDGTKTGDTKTAKNEIPQKTIDTSTASAKFGQSFYTMFGGSCSTYQCWINKVWLWATAIMVPISIIMLVIAGVLWSTSAGNPDKITLSKKIIIGVISGIALIVLARVFMLNFIGINPDQWNIKQ
jgi:hypothetical protein